MERIDRYETLSQMVSDHLHRGVRANTMVTEKAYGPAIAAGTLTAQATPAGLLLARDRGDHFRLNFYLNDLTVPLGAELPVPSVTEVAFRPQDAGLQEAVRYLQSQGFQLILERYRMSRKAQPAGKPALPPVVPGPSDGPRALSFLQENFSTLTGCLPDLRELTEDLAQGQVLLLEDSRGIAGLLRFTFDGKSGEIRHLAVREDLRGRGLTQPLIAGFLQATGGAKSVVWLRTDFPQARAAYEKQGFVPDGRRSAVLYYTKKEGFPL